MGELAETINEAVERGSADRLNSLIAVMVAATATFMALCNVKDGNIVQAMEQDQAAAVDAWSLYQAKGMKLNLAEATLDQLTLERDLRSELGAAARARLDKKIADYTAKARTYEAEKSDIMAKAKGFKDDYDSLNVHDDQFDLAEALMSVAIALFGITALIRKRLLLGFGIAFASLAIIFGFAGFLRL